MAASKTDLIVTEYCNQNINKIDCFRNVSLLATIPGPVGPCAEKYLTIAPSQSHECRVHPARHFRHTRRLNVYKISRDARHAVCDDPGLRR